VVTTANFGSKKRVYDVDYFTQRGTEAHENVAAALAAQAAAKADSAIRLIEAGGNIGFAAGNNLAAGQARGQWLALLNPDAFPDRGWLTALVAAARQHPEAASFGSWQRLDGRPGLLDGVGDVYHISGVAWRDGHGKVCGDRYEPDCEIFSACAAAALYRRQAFLEVGGFDEDFFCYFEDVDLGFRLRLAGYAARAVAARRRQPPRRPRPHAAAL
jgi:GT2 family glycosyltransferase